MKKIESFLNSDYYIFLIFAITFISWSNYEITPPNLFSVYNMIGIVVIVFLTAMILSFYKNTLYIVPNIIGILFIISKSDMSFETVVVFDFHYLAFLFFLLGPIVHMIRFKPKFTKGHFFLGFLLIALAYIAPLIYLPFDLKAIPVSLMGTLYLILYLFFNATLKGNKDYLFKVMLMANLLLTAQVGFYIYQGYMLLPDADLYTRLLNGWNRNLGWANINDMCFYIALTYPAYAYFIRKYPKQIYFWLLSSLPILAVILSKSRGGIIGFTLIFLMSLIYLFHHRNKRIIINGIITFTLLAGLMYGFREVLIEWYALLIDSFGEDLNAFSSNRIEIYRGGLEVFRQYPLFGGGWTSAINLFDNRIFMYHSTIIQTLGAMGLFGLVALIVHYKEVLTCLLKDKSTMKVLFLLGYIATQVHGLIDNVQYAVPYSILMVMFLVIIDSSEKENKELKA